MSAEIVEAVKALGREKGISEEKLMGALEDALLSAYKKQPGAARYAALLGPLGASIEVLDGPPGLAASKKLLRSVFYKGMAASIVEALEAARAAGDEPWLREHIAAELTAADAATVDRITDGTRRHAVRRAAEMAAAAEMLTELGVPPLMAAASRALHERLTDGETAT